MNEAFAFTIAENVGQVVQEFVDRGFTQITIVKDPDSENYSVRAI